MRLYIISTTNSCISHDSSTTTNFISCCLIPITTAAIAGLAFKRMVTSKLVAHFMGYIIDIISITYRTGASGNPLCFLRTCANHTKSCYTTTACTENMADIIISTSDYACNCRLVLPKHCTSIIICIWVGCSVKVNKIIIICYQYKSYG